MNLREPMVNPGSLDFRSNVDVSDMQLQKAFHFSRHVLRRAVLVYHPVGSARIVRQLLVVAFQQGDVETIAQCVDGRRGGLVACK